MNHGQRFSHAWHNYLYPIVFIALPLIMEPSLAAQQQSTSEQSHSLDGIWQVHLAGSDHWHNTQWRDIQVPGTIEDQIDVDFDGVSVYKRSLPTFTPTPGNRVWLEFDGVATHATVSIDGQILGSHLGGWTPFQFDVTAWFARDNGQRQPELQVVVDERVGHNTQGFLPIIAPHFGGIWQHVRLVERTANEMVIARTLAIGDPVEKKILLEIPMRGSKGNFEIVVELSTLPFGGDASELEFETIARLNNEQFQAIAVEQQNKLGSAAFPGIAGVFSSQLPVSSFRVWSPDAPNIHHLRLSLRRDAQIVQQEIVPIAFRHVETQSEKIMLNGAPLVVRGVLNWGYSPPSNAPSLDEQWMRNEIEFAKSHGFNLMKFCLWIPPKRYFELCDELGMLAWVEYPTWHPKLDQKHLAELRIEYDEFFHFDRNHPSVILRSLTCETGPSADIAVITELYNHCKRVVPSAIVVDDSSWISWNRVFDFFDDHPYGNNHTWVATISKLKDYIARRETKPLVLGEAIAADTWFVAPTEMQPDEQGESGLPWFFDARSAHAPWSLESNAAWRDRMIRLAAEHKLQFSPQKLLDDSKLYGLLMRKYQIETYRREMPFGGYVVSVIRDFPKAAMGLIGFDLQPKFSADEWQFQSDVMLILETPDDRRSFESGESVAAKFYLRNASRSELDAGQLHVRFVDHDTGEWIKSVAAVTTPSVPNTVAADPLIVDLDFPVVEHPRQFRVEAVWQSDEQSFANQWPVWVFPATELGQYLAQIAESAIELFEPMQLEPLAQSAGSRGVIATRVVDDAVLAALESGSNVWLIPNGQKGSFSTTDHWFLRGAPAVFHGSDLSADEMAWRQRMLVELQHFDLAGPVVPQIDHFVGFTVPHLLLWDNHDMRETRTHAIAFEMPVGRGRLLVTTCDITKPAGRWWAADLVRRLPNNNEPTELATANLSRMRAEIKRQEISLHERRWNFSPDPDRSGIEQGWHTSNFDDGDWDSITADRHWEGQGYANLDHWAWYRLTVELPADWANRCYLNFSGVDDYCDIYIDGQFVGSMGDIEKRETAFDMRRSFDISSHVKPGASFCIAVAVYDWYGAGGLFRPITLSTQPQSESRPILTGR